MSNGVRDPFAGHRNSRGQFAEGNPGGPGRPVGNAFPIKFDKIEEFESQIVGKLVAMAIRGDMRAIKLCLAYRRGEPVARTIQATMEAEGLDFDQLMTAFAEWRKQEEGASGEAEGAGAEEGLREP